MICTCGNTWWSALSVLQMVQVLENFRWILSLCQPLELSHRLDYLGSHPGMGSLVQGTEVVFPGVPPPPSFALHESARFF